MSRAELSSPKRNDADYVQRILLRASPERVFEAVTTIAGLQGWWTPLVSGSPEPGSEVRFDFQGLKQHGIVMRVDEAKRPSSVQWTCIEHSPFSEWNGTRITFELAAAGPAGTELRFRHIGLTPRFECYDMCRSGWDYFLESLASYVDDGKGSPFGSK